MPGCGKSTIGRQLARVRQLPFVDSDHEIERALGCSIREYFDREGEPAFRDVEQRVLGELLQVADPRQRLRDLFTVRDPLYREVAHVVVDTAHKTAPMLVSLISMQLDMSGESAQDVE